MTVISKTIAASAAASLAAIKALVEKYNLPEEEAYTLALEAHTASMKRSYELGE